MRLHVEFEVQVPDEVTRSEVEEWLSFQLGGTSSMSIDNPLVDRDLDGVQIKLRWT